MARIHLSRHRLRDERGQAAVEFALLFPLVAVVIALVVQLGLAFVHYNNVMQVAGDAARLAAVDRDPLLAFDGATDILRNGEGQLDGPPAMCASLSGTGVGDTVTVEVTSEWSWLPLVDDIVNVDPFQLTGRATMRLERKPTFTLPAC